MYTYNIHAYYTLWIEHGNIFSLLIPLPFSLIFSQLYKLCTTRGIHDVNM